MTAPDNAAASIPGSVEPVHTALTADRVDDFYAVMERGFQEKTPPALAAAERQIMTPERFFGFTVGPRWISTFGSAEQHLTVPGGADIPISAITAVTVHSAYHRRGLLRRAMTEELHRCRERGEVAAALYASESSIYGRFGFGIAAYRASLSGRTDTTRFRPEITAALDRAGGAVDEVDQGHYLQAAAPLHNRLTASRPGSLRRTADWWALHLADPPEWRDGATELRYVLSYDADGHVDGHATYAVRVDETDGNPSGELRVGDLEAENPTATARLWRYLAGLDLVRTFTVRQAPVDHGLHYQIANPRTIATKLIDSLYLRLIDIPTALTARRYAAPIDTVLDVIDEVLPEGGGRYRLRGGPDGAEVTRTDDRADFSLAARDLGAAYLGGTRLSAIHAAGLVAEYRPGAVAAATAAMSWPVEPFCGDMF